MTDWSQVGPPALTDAEVVDSKASMEWMDGYHAAKTERGGGPVAADPVAAPWGPPVPFGDYDLPSFPVDALPEPLHSFAGAVATATQTPVDMSALLGLAAAAAALGTKARIQAGPGWFEPLCLFIVVVLGPGNRKSGVFAEVMQPITEWERVEAERLAPDIAKAQSERKVLEARHEHLIKKAASANDAATAGELRSQAADIARELAKLVVPVPRQVTADDVTAEALAALMYEHHGAIGVLSAEGGGPFALMAGRYSDGAPNFEVYLKGHAGDMIKVNRRSRPPLFVPHPALTMGLTLQPEVLRAIADIPGARGRGLLARFIYSLPASLVGARDCNPTPVPESVRSEWSRRLVALLELGLGDDGKPHLIHLDAAARNELLAYMREIEPHLRASGRLGGVTDWASKLAGAVVRIAGVMHAIEHGAALAAAPLALATIQHAIRLGRYATDHAIAAHGEMGADPATTAARWLLDHLRRKDAESFTVRSLFSDVSRGRFQKVAHLEQAIGVLVDHGYVRRCPDPPRQGAGRPPSPTYEVYPEINFADCADIAAGGSAPKRGEEREVYEL